jgi:hypothetical protein
MKYAIERAQELVAERGESYDDPTKDFYRIAELWTALHDKKIIFKPQDVARMMILLKLSRSSKDIKYQDNLDDIVGYTHCWDLINRNGI